MRVLYHNRTRLAPELERELNAEFVSMERVLSESDFISIHVPLSDTPSSNVTRHLIGERELRLMKPEAILVNTSRGPVVDEAALARALREKWITAAGIDVFEREPEVHPDLLACTNAVLAPHVGSASVATRMKMTMMAAENALAAIEGRRPPNLVNPAAWANAAT
jgi:glyoxylate reductase